jgi:GT2 family glycosyltransferase/tetratricopeptide (TPR) repeat protein
MASLRRPGASIVIPVWNQWQMTKGCLESLRPTLGVRDEVIVVDNGSVDATAKGLAAFPWVKVITNDENRGFAIACNQGLAAATGEAVVFLNNDTLLTPRWLDSLLAPFADPSVGATGPRSNMVSGPQLVEPVDYAMGRTAELRRFARAWGATHRDQTAEVSRLVGFCLAVRHDALDQVGGFDEGFAIGGFEDDDLCARLRTGGWRLLIAHESFVHHHGHATFDANGLDWFAIQNANKDRFLAKHTAGEPGQPLLSAALIVKDEEALLPACLASLKGVVDEIVVYDTGSTDATMRIAEEAGATVIAGYWDDDFARARNAALEHCHGQWILSIDADEVIKTKAKEIRRTISNAVADAGSIEIVNLAGDEGSTHVALRHHAIRLFRRDRCHWHLRLHEQVVARPGRPEITIGTVDGLQIIHSGYLAKTMIERDKGARNIRIAEADLASNDTDRAQRLLSLGRSLIMAGRNQEALERFREVIAEDCPDFVRRTALRHGAEVLLAQGQPEEALVWIEDLQAISSSSAMTRFLEGTARLLLGDPDAAAALLEDVDDLQAEDGVAYSNSSLQAKKGFARTALGDWEGAADMFVEAASDPTMMDPIWSPMVESHLRTNRSLAPVVDAVSPIRLVPVLGQMMTSPPESADAFAEALWQRMEGDNRILALAIRIGPKLAVSRALEWSARLRQQGLFEDCPVIAIANDDARPAADRIMAAAIAHTAFNDARAKPSIEAAAAALPEADLVASFTQVSDLAPSLLPALIEAAASSADRSAAVGQALDALGAPEAAETVRAFGREHYGPPTTIAPSSLTV